MTFRVVIQPEGREGPQGVFEAEGGQGPILPRLRRLAQTQAGRNAEHVVGIEVRELDDVLGTLYPLAPVLRCLGAVLVQDGVTVREGHVGDGRYMTVFACRGCDGAGCLRCHHTGEMRGKR